MTNPRNERTHLREIAKVIGSQPVMGHWPPMRAELDSSLVTRAADEIERAQRIMRRAVDWLQIKEAAFATHKGKAIIEEMQGFLGGASHDR